MFERFKETTRGRPHHHRAGATAGERAHGGRRAPADETTAMERDAATPPRRARGAATRTARRPRRQAPAGRGRDRHGPARVATRDHLRTAPRPPARGVRRHQLGRRLLRLARRRRPRLAAGRDPRGRRHRRRPDQNVTETDATSNAEDDRPRRRDRAAHRADDRLLQRRLRGGPHVALRRGPPGLGAWLFGIAVTIVLALAAVILGSKYNVLDQLNLPSLPVGDATLDHRRRDRARRRRARLPAGRRGRRQGRASATPRWTASSSPLDEHDTYPLVPASGRRVSRGRGGSCGYGEEHPETGAAARGRLPTSASSCPEAVARRAERRSRSRTYPSAGGPVGRRRLSARAPTTSACSSSTACSRAS